jgi:RNA polymerase sigma-70 factor (sigma-E family)
MADPVAFDNFVVARSPALLRTAYLLTQDRGVAEDLLQTALTKTWFAWGRLNDDDPVRYVRRVLVTTSVSWRRRFWSRERPTEVLPEGAAPGDESVAAVGQDLWAAIGRLPPRQRAVVVLRYYEDLTEVETAQLLDCSTGTVKSQCSKAMAKLRQDASLVPIDSEGIRW